MLFWAEEYKNRELSTHSDGPIKTYRNLDVTCNISLFGKKVKDDLPIFHHQERYSREVVNLYYFTAPAEYYRHLDLNFGFINYRDIISAGEYEFVSKDDYIIDDSHLNINNKVLQIGLSYNKDEYLRAILKKSKYQRIKSRTYYILFLYGPNVAIDPIYYENDGFYEIDIKKSELEIQKIGFKVGRCINETMIGSTIGYRRGFEIALFPGIKGYPSDIFNISARVYMCVSLNFLKKNGNKLEL